MLRTGQYGPSKAGQPMSSHRPGKEFTTRTISLEPGATRQMALGSYAKSDPRPAFDITMTPDIHEDLGASLEQLDLPGQQRYVAFYHLHNFSNKRCEITVKRHMSA